MNLSFSEREYLRRMSEIQHFDGEFKKIAKFNWVVGSLILQLVLQAFSRLACLAYNYSGSPAP